jgi:hypothetical protein
MVIGFPLSLVGFITFKIADSFGDMGIALCLLPLGALFLWGSWRVQQYKGIGDEETAHYKIRFCSVRGRSR